MLKGRSDGASRKPRLFVDHTESKADVDSHNPIAAAMAARERKQGTELQATDVLIRLLGQMFFDPHGSLMPISHQLSCAEQALKAAAAAAAKAAAANVVTYFADDPPAPKHERDKGDSSAEGICSHTPSLRCVLLYTDLGNIRRVSGRHSKQSGATGLIKWPG